MNNTTKIIASFFGGLLVGGGLGYFITQSAAKKKYQDIAAEEIQSVKDHYRLINKEDYPDPTDFPISESSDTTTQANEDDRTLAREKAEEFGYATDDGDDQSEESRLASRTSILKSQKEKLEELEPRTQSIWDQQKITAGEILETLSEEDLDEDSEKGVSYSDYKALKMQDLMDKRRNGSDEAYVVTEEEFTEEETAWDRITMTYYAGDDVLCENEDPVPAGEVERLVGPDALTNFGVGSSNDAIVYVRNDRLESYFEIVQDDREYAEAILGYKQPKDNHRFREDD